MQRAGRCRVSISRGLSAVTPNPGCVTFPLLVFGEFGSLREQLKTFKLFRSYACAHVCLGNYHSASLATAFPPSYPSSFPPGPDLLPSDLPRPPHRPLPLCESSGLSVLSPWTARVETGGPSMGQEEGPAPKPRQSVPLKPEGCLGARDRLSGIVPCSGLQSHPWTQPHPPPGPNTQAD